MEEKNLIEKISQILDNYKKLDAKTWEIGTDFYQSWIRLSKNLKLVRIDGDLPTFIEIKKKYVGVDERYQILLGGVNITPTSKNNMSASESAIRQYLQEGSALGLIGYSAGDKIADKQYFKIDPKIWELKNDSNFLIENIYQILLRSPTSHIYYGINLCYSLFLSLISQYDQQLFKQLETYQIIPRTESKIIKDFLPMFLGNEVTNQFIKKIKGIGTKIFGTGKKSYVSACDQLLKTYSFYDIIDGMYNHIKNPDEIKFDNKDQKLHLEWKTALKKIENRRLNLRMKIIEQRVGDKIQYTDLEGSSSNDTDIHVLKACHIRDYWRIKKEIKKQILKNSNTSNIDHLIEEVDDPNNGILLNSTCHDMLDQQIVWFDSDGILCFRSEHKEMVKKHFGSDDLIKIKDEVLNDRMKYFIRKRI